MTSLSSAKRCQVASHLAKGSTCMTKRALWSFGRSLDQGTDKHDQTCAQCRTGWFEGDTGVKGLVGVKVTPGSEGQRLANSR